MFRATIHCESKTDFKFNTQAILEPSAGRTIFEEQLIFKDLRHVTCLVAARRIYQLVTYKMYSGIRMYLH